MADREFVSLAPRLASDVVGCPQPVLVQHIRDAAIDACERSLAWRYQITDVVTTGGKGDYQYDVPEHTDVHAIVDALVGASSERVMQRVFPVSNEVFLATYPGWPNTETGTPRRITHLSAVSYALGPVPDGAYDIAMWVCLKPKRDATGMDSVVFDDLETAIVHRALQTLLVQSNKEWANQGMAAYHAKQYSFVISERRARYNLGTPRATLIASCATTV